MKTYSIITAVLFLALQAWCAPNPSQNAPARDKGLPAQEIVQATKKEPISSEEAIGIANENAAKTYKSLEPFKVVACERARLWVIIYDGGGPEYYIDKISGAIVFVQKLPQSLNSNVVRSVSSGGTVINKTQAVEIARRHFVDFLVSQGDAKDQVDDYDAVTCELANAWRVFFEYRVAGQNLATSPNSNPPNYVIDKKSGTIIFTTHRIGK